MSRKRHIAAGRRETRPAACWAVAIGVAAIALPAAADRWIDRHDDPTTAWSLDTSGGARRLEQRRVRVPTGAGGATDTGAERVRYASPPGVTAWVWRPTPAAAVIAELRIEADVWTTVPGALLAAEVVLPNTPAAASRDDEPVEATQPLRLLLRSEPLRVRGGRLTLDDLPRRLARRTRAWRLANRDRRLDARGAYVARVAIGLPGAGGPVEALVHELAIDTIVTPATTVESSATPVAAGSGVVRPTEVTLRSDGFRIDGRSFFPRAWRHRGEPLETLARRGVNTVWLDRWPSAQTVAEAADHRLRLIAPPPTATQIAATRSWDRFLAWALPGERTLGSLDAALATRQRLDALPPAARRPIVALVASDGPLGPTASAVAAWSRAVDAVVAPSTVTRIGADGVVPAFGEGTPPGSAAIGQVDLDLRPAALGQIDALVGDGVVAGWLPPQDVAAAVDRAISAGAAGVVFRASQRIDAADNASIAAANWLATVNRRLRVIEPWLVGPRTRRGGEGDATWSVEREGSTLTLARDARGVASPLTAAVRVTPSGVFTPSAGDPPAAGDWLCSIDPRVARSLKRYTARTAAAAARDALQAATLRLAATDALAPADREVAGRVLSDARLAASRRDAGSAYDGAMRVIARLGEAEDTRLALAASGEPTESCPLAVLPGTLTDHFRLRRLMATAERGPNRLHGGSFEAIDALRGYGWRRPPVTHSVGAGLDHRAGVVELATDRPVHGEAVLRLRGDGARVIGPDVELQSGELVEVTGWARVEGPAGAALVVSDTLGGAELALVVGPTGDEWRPFRLVRRTAEASATAVTLWASGAAVADVDGLMLRALRVTPSVARAPRERR
ncbi:MAG: hypothetical protein AAF805_04835 [Planctomycetota bacterium]